MTLAITTAVEIPTQRAELVDEHEAGARERWTLIDRAQAGDSEAFAELYRLHRDTVFRIVFARLGGNRAAAEDITSMTFLRAWRSVDRLEYRGREFAAFLTVIAKNLIADYYKSGAMRSGTCLGLDATPEAAEPMWAYPAPDPARTAERRDLAQAIEAALADLTITQAQVIRLRFLHGCSVEETAEATGLTIGGVKAAQYRATRALRRSQALAAHR